MLRRPFRCGLILVLVAIFITWSVAAFAAEDPTLALYKAKCAPCHGADGTGNTPVGKSLHVKSLASEEVQKLKDAELTKVLHDGQGKMPAFGGKITDDQIKDLVGFIRTLAPKK